MQHNACNQRHKAVLKISFWSDYTSVENQVSLFDALILLKEEKKQKTERKAQKMPKMQRKEKTEV